MPQNDSSRPQPQCWIKFLDPWTQDSLRAKGTLIGEPRFSSPGDMPFFPREKGKMVLFEGFSLKMALFPVSRGKNRVSQAVENRGSLISVPLALRVFIQCWAGVWHPQRENTALPNPRAG